jgi:hypothetical protein
MLPTTDLVAGEALLDDVWLIAAKAGVPSKASGGHGRSWVPPPPFFLGFDLVGSGGGLERGTC